MTLTVMPALAGAAPTYAGALEMKGAGSAYSTFGGSLAVAAGSKASFPIRVVNQGPQPTQFVLTAVPGGATAADVLLTGSTDVLPEAVSPGYVTPPIAPGKYAAMTLTITPSAAATQAQVGSVVDLTMRAYGGSAQLGEVQGLAVIKAPAKGSTGWDGFVKTTANQPFVGGSYSQLVIAPPITPSQHSTFTVRLQNDSGVPDTIGLSLPWGCPDWPITVKDGLQDVTALAKAGRYRTPTLAAGAHRDLTVTVGFGGGGCPDDGVWDAQILKGSTGAAVEDQELFTVPAAPGSSLGL